jgi:hypothetical protein
MLLQEKLASNKRLGQLVDMNMRLAKKLRYQAEQAADDKDYDSAIKLMEDSTKQIIRAIRAAGVYIPG